jgi:hypothetical protein
MVEVLLAGIFSSILATVIAGVMVHARRRWKQGRERIAAELDELRQRRFEAGVGIGHIRVGKAIEGDQKTRTLPLPDLYRRIEEQIGARVAASPHLSKEEVQQEIDEQLGEVQKRVAKIEARFPDEAKLEKIASINDALLSERIDQLSRQVEDLQRRTLTKWDVALTVSTIIAGIASVVGATYAVVKFLGQAA